MLLTITYRGEHSDELGYLLHKNPARAQQFALSFGRAYVFYPEVTETQTTAAVLLDLNPVDLARGKAGSASGGLFDYVNDRPYVASSFMSNALVKIFSTAMSGRCEKRPQLAEKTLDLEAKLTMLPCRGEADLVRRIFEPLGYEVNYESFILDEEYPDWGESDYLNVSLRGTVRLCELLNHLYVLIPVFDRQKHYWMADEEVAKLLRHGEGWLAGHPERTMIINRYLNKRKSLVNTAFRRLVETEEPEEAEEPEAEDEAGEPAADIMDEAGIGRTAADYIEEAETGAKANGTEKTFTAAAASTEKTETCETADGVSEGRAAAATEEPRAEDGGERAAELDDTRREQLERKEKKLSLNKRRLEAAAEMVRRCGASSVIDMGCGEGQLLALLLNQKQLTRIAGTDVSVSALERAEQRLHLERMPEAKRKKLRLFQGALTYRDKRFEGYDAACVIEVIEHLDPERLSAFERVVFEFAAPQTVVLTTPNAEYNVNYEGLAEDDLRHSDHRFEWSRKQFRNWTQAVCEAFGYTCEFFDIGDVDEVSGTPTQMGVFTRCE